MGVCSCASVLNLVLVCTYAVRPSPGTSASTGSTYQPHTPVMPPDPPIYHLNPNSALTESERAEETPGMGVVQTLLKHKSLIVRPPGNLMEAEAAQAGLGEEDEDRHQDCCSHEVFVQI